MFKSIKTFISSLVEAEGFRNRTESSKCQLATAALLTRVATVHSEMSQARRAKLHAVLKLHFDLAVCRKNLKWRVFVFSPVVLGRRGGVGCNFAAWGWG